MSRSLAGLVVAAAAQLVAAGPPPTPTLAPTAGACPGARQLYAYPVVLKGPAALRGFAIGHFAAWSRRNGRFLSVPIQVEEVNPAGDYVLAGGLPFTKNTGTGIFNERDELVAAGEDFGDDFAAGDVEPALAAPARAQWKVGFCRGGRRAGWLLVQAVRQARPSAAPAAVRFDPARAEVRTDQYAYRFDAKNPVLLGEVTLRHGAVEVPAITASKFLMPLNTPFFLPDMLLEDQDFTSSIESWQQGPLRTIVAVGIKYTSFLSVFKLHLFSELVFYRNRFTIPTVIQFVFDPQSYLSAGSGIAYALRFPPQSPWTVQSNLAPLPRLPPDQALERARKATDTEVFYARAHGPGGSFLVQVRVDPKARKAVPSPFLLEAADLRGGPAAEHWPWLKDLGPGDLGVFLDFSRIHQGTYNFGLDLLVSPKANESFTDYGSVDSEWQSLPTHQ